MEDATQMQISALFIKSMLEFCTDKCIERPQKELSAQEKQCLAMCQDRFQEAFQLTFQKLTEELKGQQDHF